MTCRQRPNTFGTWNAHIHSCSLTLSVCKIPLHGSHGEAACAAYALIIAA